MDVKKRKLEIGGELVSVAYSKKSRYEKKSTLPYPIMQLSYHKSEVLTTKFNSIGTILANGSFDKTISLWNTVNYVNYFNLIGHKNAVLDLDWSIDGETLFSCSADKTVMVWDVETGTSKKCIRAHSAIVNCVSSNRSSPFLFCSSSDDGLVKVWDVRTPKKSMIKLAPEANGDVKYPVFSCCFNLSGEKIFSCGLENNIKIWDLRGPQVFSEEIAGHKDSITDIKLSPDGAYLASTSMDNTVRIFDCQPFVSGGGDRCKKVFFGACHGIDRNLLRTSWSPKGARVGSGSADYPTHVYIWDVALNKILYKLPGHRGTVNEIAFHPSEPVIASASSDKTVMLGEIEPE